ncbi:MAG TPA: toprim domain-containing protein, partial [Acidobacteriaceae bacterium]|nr:toprim domain-containing protein [Acidobacteriaceae bacterium]
QLRIANLLTRLVAPLPASGAEENGNSPYPIESSAEIQTSDPNIREVILALSPTTEGEATAAYIAHEIRRIAPAIRITRIATGVPAGSDIEYADEVTMTRALEGRRDF